MSDDMDFESVDFVTIDTVGDPGDRVFHLQAGHGTKLLTLIIEKEQASALADGIVSILEEIREKFSRSTVEPAQASDMGLREPIQPWFRVGQIGLGYDSESDRLVLMFSELQVEDVTGDQRVARIRLTREQTQRLATHARTVVAGGRPICGNCGRPIDPDGHFCPKSNGHRRESESV